ncbi:helix-turn-helix domain-containing protein [Burkholderia multivorans]|uniref:helix-turn-helix domain-containing protein n=1 Tax=Burkholderia multivorans TaxID=87883 RepID=UPI000D0117B7|nr:helix-turn-helix transcriptional regulator [Burkholderia multivorans]MBY4791620.1 helix-turn-helix domain-containing protein [Burkholderia multivorans]PRE59490.1 transcriptional regulator [Burkholderia multivorans]PRE77049.1 transcriptional regulator [Burkholderia multivorans]PRG17265.1 transcriptional regulator [Burkholderia multivorans]
MDKEVERRLAQSVGRAIAKRRAEAGYTQEEVAEKLGLGRSAVARVEQGIAIPTVVRLVELAELFGCRVDDLLVEGSTRPDDQAARIAQQLAPLKADERQLLIEWMQSFAAQFAKK